MTPRYLGVTGFAEYVGLADSTIQGYLRKNMLPEPDIYYIMRGGRRPAWTIDTIEDWMNNRPGSGRTYESMKRHPSNNSTKENN
jgi:predicted DNA-binding transcriptional regulator AlpA